jgi:hypothetical protein
MVEVELRELVLGAADRDEAARRVSTWTECPLSMILSGEG